MTNEEAIKIFKEIREEVIAKETELSRQVFENLGIKAIDVGIKALEQTRWIPVSERLPDMDENVLVYDGENMFVAWVKFDGFDIAWTSFDISYDSETPIIAWMPLPEPYRESEE